MNDPVKTKMLHPIYAALDSYDYRRAVKLCLALPKTNELGQALLAHALHKSGQTKKCYGILQSLFGPGWSELEALPSESLGDTTTTTTTTKTMMNSTATGTTAATATTTVSTSTAISTATSTVKGRKKTLGKQKKPTTIHTIQTATLILPQQQQQQQQQSQDDVVLRLSQPITIAMPTSWQDSHDPPIHNAVIFQDDTIVETLSMTLSSLRLLETNYYLWKLSGLSLVRQFKAAIHIVLAKQDMTILPTLQIIALQLAQQDNLQYSKWISVVALWQLTFQNCHNNTNHNNTNHNNNDHNNNDNHEKSLQQKALLSRLAQSIASKSVESAQDFYLLYAAWQSSENRSSILLEWLNRPIIPPTQHCIPLGTIQRLEWKAECFEYNKEWNMGIPIWQELLQLQPDQWSYWKALANAGYQQGEMKDATIVIHQTLLSFQDTIPNRRSHGLIHCHLAAMTIFHEKQCTDANTNTDALSKSLQEYAALWASQASCTFSDVEAYLDLWLSRANQDQMTTMYEWTYDLYQEHTSVQNRSNLRTYIFAIQCIYKLVLYTKQKEWLPDWRAIVTTWRGFSSAKSIQKENQPADELILLAIQGLLYDTKEEGGEEEGGEEEEQHLIMAATLLELGTTKSPYNPYIKIHLLQVYAKLQAYDESWRIFRDLGIKHIQIDSCTFLIMNHLFDGGMYRQACIVASDIMKFHGTALRDAGDFIGVAMEEGNFSKADDFIKFQLNHMSPSLAVLEARGVVLDCAPAMEGQLGITGDESDVENAKSIATEVHSIFGAPSLLTECRTTFSDNRDKSILDFQILNKYMIESESSIITTAGRRKMIHGLLVRAVLVLDATKPLKKGKLVLPSESLKLRSQSLFDAVAAIDDSNEWINVMKTLCSAILLVSSGMSENGEDSLLLREERVTKVLLSMTIPNHTEWTRPSVCRFISDYLVSMKALLETLAKEFAIIGWGKRKQRVSVSALAKVAAALGLLVSSIKAAYMSTNIEVVHCEEVIDLDIHDVVVSKVRSSRSSPRTEYVVALLEEMEQSLASFAPE